MAIDGGAEAFTGIGDPQDDRFAALAQHVVDGACRLVQALDQGFAMAADAGADRLTDSAKARGDRFVLAGQPQGISSVSPPSSNAGLP